MFYVLKHSPVQVELKLRALSASANLPPDVLHRLPRKRGSAAAAFGNSSGVTLAFGV